MEKTEDKPVGQFWIDDFKIDPDGLMLHGPVGEVSLEPKIMQVLVTLAENPGQMVSRDVLMDKVWAVEFGSDESLTRAISILRKNFGDAHGRRAIIETIPRKGYKLVGTVSKDDPARDEPPTAVAPTISEAPVSDLTYKNKRGLKGVIAAGLALAVVVLGWQFFTPGQQLQADTGSSITKNAGSTQSIAVLPFEDFSAEKDQEYFANGISEELLNVLAKVDGLRVASRTSAFAFKDSDASMTDIAEALDVGHVLEGSVRKSGTTLRITAQLIDTSNDEHLWSETYDRALTAENLFAVQDEIAAAIVTALKGEITLNATPAHVRTSSLEAYELYLLAREQGNTRRPDSLRAAVENYKQVIALDADFAPAFSGLADAYLLMDTYAGASADESIRLATPYVERALVLDPDSAEALSSASFLAMTKHDKQAAIDFAVRAVAANPNHADAYHRLGLAYNTNNQTEAALAAWQKGRALDPLSGVLLSNISSTHKKLDQMVAAKATASDNIRWNPDEPFGYLNLADLLWVERDYTGAHSLLKDAQALNPAGDTTQYSLSGLYEDVGMYDEAAQVVDGPERKAIILALKGEKEAALNLLPEDADPMSRIQVHYFLRDYPEILAIIANLDTEMYAHMFEIMPYKLSWYAGTTFVYHQQGDPDTAARIAALVNYFDGKGPEDFDDSDALEAGAILYIVKDDPNTAYQWIKRMNDLGHVSNILDCPPFDELRETSEFRLHVVGMESNRTRHREAIQAKLANPKPLWVKTD
jgi:TolB-like protein/DNA-binding winged helix-turn-helix (wHTH) protein